MGQRFLAFLIIANWAQNIRTFRRPNLNLVTLGDWVWPINSFVSNKYLSDAISPNYSVNLSPKSNFNSVSCWILDGISLIVLETPSSISAADFFPQGPSCMLPFPTHVHLPCPHFRRRSLFWWLSLDRKQHHCYNMHYKALIPDLKIEINANFIKHRCI